MKRLILGLAVICAACSQGRLNRSQPQTPDRPQGGGGGTIQSLFEKECPKLAKLWQDGDKKQVTFARGENGTGFMTIFDKSVGDMQFIIDGQIHPIDEVNNYIGVCNNGVVSVGFKHGDRTPMAIFYGLSKSGNIIRQITKKGVIVDHAKLTPLQGKIELPAQSEETGEEKL